MRHSLLYTYLCLGDSKESTRKLNTDAVEVYVQVKRHQNVCTGNIEEGGYNISGFILMNKNYWIIKLTS